MKCVCGSIDPRDSEQLGRFVFESFREAFKSRNSATFDYWRHDTLQDVHGRTWEQLEEPERASWRETARQLHERFAPESAADAAMQVRS